MVAFGTSDNRFFVCIRSIGRAAPSAALAVARGCSGAGDDFLRAIYRAPVILGEDLDQATAEELARVLAGLGFEADAAPMSHAATIDPGPLVDVALACLEPANLDEIARRLAQFCAIPEQTALAQLVTAPGVVLGGVSMATATALTRRLEGLGVEVMVSDPQAARYTLVAGNMPATLLDRLVRDLGARGIAGAALSRGTGEVTAQDLPYDIAQAIWKAYARSGLVRIVNQAFLRFSVQCTGLARPQQVAPVAQALQARFAIPPEVVPHLLREPVVTLAENLPLATALDHVAALSAVGLKVVADLEGFAPVQVEIAAARDHAAMLAVLGAFGIAISEAFLALPYRSPPMALPLARCLRARLEAGAGADACLAQVAA